MTRIAIVHEAEPAEPELDQECVRCRTVISRRGQVHWPAFMPVLNLGRARGWTALPDYADIPREYPNAKTCKTKRKAQKFASLGH